MKRILYDLVTDPVLYNTILYFIFFLLWFSSSFFPSIHFFHTNSYFLFTVYKSLSDHLDVGKKVNTSPQKNHLVNFRQVVKLMVTLFFDVAVSMALQTVSKCFWITLAFVLKRSNEKKGKRVSPFANEPRYNFI